MASMTAFLCARDCRAEIVYFEENRPLKCWNCQRVWVIDPEGVPVETSPAVPPFPTRTLPRGRG